jgi:hypothetical protein
MAGRADFPYSPVPESVKRLLEKIPSVGVPDKVDRKWLTALGLGGGNNEMSVPLFKQLGILDSSAAPTDFYRAIRSKDKAKVGVGIKAAYSALFALYPDANRQDDEALMAFARSQTDYPEGTQRLAVRTFKVLVGFGDFDGSTASTSSGGEERDERGSGERSGSRGSSSPKRSPVGLTVNIQLQLPPSADGEIYDKLFAAMAKHLKGLVSLE